MKMKSIVLLTLTSLMIVGCKCKTDAQIQEEQLNEFQTIVIDSCEYLFKREWAHYRGFGYLAHKGNCRFCKERRQKELEEMFEPKYGFVSTEHKSKEKNERERKI